MTIGENSLIAILTLSLKYYIIMWCWRFIRLLLTYFNSLLKLLGSPKIPLCLNKYASKTSGPVLLVIVWFMKQIDHKNKRKGNWQSLLEKMGAYVYINLRICGDALWLLESLSLYNNAPISQVNRREDRWNQWVKSVRINMNNYINRFPRLRWATITLGIPERRDPRAQYSVNTLILKSIPS